MGPRHIDGRGFSFGDFHFLKSIFADGANAAKVEEAAIVAENARTERFVSEFIAGMDEICRTTGFKITNIHREGRMLNWPLVIVTIETDIPDLQPAPGGPQLFAPVVVQVFGDSLYVYGASDLPGPEDCKTTKDALKKVAFAAGHAKALASKRSPNSSNSPRRWV